MRREELITQGALYFERIEQGMEEYEWQSICVPAQKAGHFRCKQTVYL